MKRHSYAVICTAALLALPANLYAAGFATSDNFQVLTPNMATDQESSQYAAEVLRCAEWWRNEIAREWLGQELPPSVGHTIINVTFRADRDAGLTWAKDDPRRRSHVLYLATTPDQALGNTLAHEMVHVVLATRYPAPQRLPAWLEEGIASRYDDDARRQVRQDLITWLLETHNWPNVESVLAAANIPASDKQAYTVAASITNFLLERDADKAKLFEFGQAGGKHGWDAALQTHYGIAGVDQLQRQWQRWLMH